MCLDDDFTKTRGKNKSVSKYGKRLLPLFGEFALASYFKAHLHKAFLSRRSSYQASGLPGFLTLIFAG